MLILHGFALSNYYNKVKLVLLEKEVPFQEHLTWPDKSPGLLEHSPLGKIPYLETAQGTLCESQVIVDFLEQAYPSKALMPGDAFAAAKVRELIVFLELHLELEARKLYPQAFFGKSVADDIKTGVHANLVRNIKAFTQLVKFSPYIAGNELSLADCAAAVHLPLIAMASKAIFKEDLLASLPIQRYMKMLGERASMQKVAQDRKANQEIAAARMR